MDSIDGRIVAAAALGLFVYFIPYIVAIAKGKENSLAILLVNGLFGWTLVGWVAALVWAVLKEKEPQPPPYVEEFTSFAPVIPIPPVTQAPQKKCPDCAEMILAEARKCRFCGYEFGPAIPAAGQP